MKIINEITVSFTEKELQILISEQLKKEGYELKGNIKINTGIITRGFGLSEHDNTEFKNITCLAVKI